MSRVVRRSLWVAGIGVIAAVATGAFVVTTVPTAAEEADPVADRSTASVTRRTLRVVDGLEAQLDFGTPQPVSTRQPGTLTAAPNRGDTIERNGALFEVDARPVTLLYGDVPAWRSMQRGDRGEDVRQLKENLAALGYGDGLTVDDVFGPYTLAAVKAWQANIGAEVDGVVDLGEVVFVPQSVRVAELTAQLGDEVGPGVPVLDVTGTGRLVTLDLPAARRGDVTTGDSVEVELPGDRVATGTVDAVASTVDTDEQSGKQTVEVTVSLTEGDAEGVPDGPVKIRLVRQERTDVLAVPVTALLALLEGGYAVEVVANDGATQLVAVEVGLFADGWVEVRGEVAEGDKVVVP